MKITIVDIAKKLDINPSTVSLALRDSPKISAKTTALVKKTAEEMGYRRNPYVSALMSARRQGKTPDNPPAIAFITSSDSPEGWQEKYASTEFYAGCANIAASLGMKLESFWIGEKTMSAERLNEILYNRGIQGAILLPTGTFRHKMNHDWQHIAAVSYGIYDIAPGIDRVKADFYGNMEQVISCLTEQGISRIGFAMDTPYPYKNNNRWLAAYLMYTRDLSPRKRLQPFLDEKPTAASFHAWFEKQKPDVIICIDPVLVEKWLQQIDCRVPEDVGLVTMGMARQGKSFSGIIENAATCGKIAMEMLLDRIHHNQFGTPEAPRYVTVRGRWNPGKTLHVP